MMAIGYPPNPRTKKRQSYIVYKLGREFDSKGINAISIVNYAHYKYPAYKIKKTAAPVFVTGNDIIRVNQGELPLQENFQNLKIIDLFAGLGGFHHAFDKLGQEMGFHLNQLNHPDIFSPLLQNEYYKDRNPVSVFPQKSTLPVLVYILQREMSYRDARLYQVQEDLSV